MRTNTAKVIEVLTVTEELNLIREDNNGLISPRNVVEFARDPNTSLHNKFEWDNKKAGDNYRLWQARRIIRLELVVVSSCSDGKIIISDMSEGEIGAGDNKIRAYVSLQNDRAGDDSGGYRSLTDVMSNEEYRDQLLEMAKKDMIIFKQKYGVLSKLSKVFMAMDEIIE